MDMRTEEQKMHETALRSEPRVIGGPVSDKVLVIAPTHREAQDWAAAHNVSYSRTVFIGPANYMDVFRGQRGTPHVILRWYAFPEAAREDIKGWLQVIGSEPFELDDELSTAAALRD